MSNVKLIGWAEFREDGQHWQGKGGRKAGRMEPEGCNCLFFLRGEKPVIEEVAFKKTNEMMVTGRVWTAGGGQPRPYHTRRGCAP